MINFSEILWKDHSKKLERTSTHASKETRDPDEDSLLGVVPVEYVKTNLASRIALETDPLGPGADRFRLLRMRLRDLKATTKLRSLIITSPLPKDGKSTIALNLATALAEGGKRSVLLVESDLHHPTLAHRLGVQVQPGLAECIEGGLDPISLIRRIEPLGWYFMQAGTPKGNATELHQSDSLSRMMLKLTNFFDWILLDTPPVVPLTDALSLSRQVDASLLVVRADHTPREAVEESLNLLGRKHVVGIVFNCADGLNEKYAKYYGYYGKQPVASRESD